MESFNTNRQIVNKSISKRTFIIFFTSIIDDINYKMFLKWISILSRKHFVLFIVIKDPELYKIANSRPDSDTIYKITAARQIVLNIEETIKKMKTKKINVLDVEPEKLSPSLVNKYFEVKSKNLI